MCQSKADGGHRCPPTPTARAARHLRAQDTPEARAALDRLHAARSLYGPIVTPLSIPVPEPVSRLLETLSGAGNPLLVGGTVRDAITDGRVPKDFDIEVHGADMDTLARTLRRAGYQVDEVGRQFGVLKTRVGRGEDAEDIDISVPRRDSLTGEGHRGFEVEVDSDMGVKEAAARRDFTINAMMYDAKNEVCIDPYRGREDLEAGVLRHVSDAFGEDPLRPLRAFQFAGRYGLRLAPETARVCRTLRARAEELPTERVRGEWAKFYTKSSSPSRSLKALKQMGWDDTVPGLSTVNPAHVDKVAKSGPVLMGAVMTRNMSENDSREFLRRTIEGDDIARRAHLLGRTHAPQSLDRASMRRWARELGAKNLRIADWEERERAVRTPVSQINEVMVAARQHGVAYAKPSDHLQGRDVLPLTSRKPGPWLGALLAEATNAQDRGDFNTRDEAFAWLRSRPELQG